MISNPGLAEHGVIPWSMRLRIPNTNNRTLAPIGVKPRRLGDNPGPPVAPASTRSRRTVRCSATIIFEVTEPGLQAGLRVIASAKGRLAAPRWLMNANPKGEARVRS
jgi:hypothetical protein